MTDFTREGERIWLRRELESGRARELFAEIDFPMVTAASIVRISASSMSRVLAGKQLPRRLPGHRLVVLLERLATIRATGDDAP